MSREDKLLSFMECSLSYSLIDEAGKEKEKGEAHARLDEESFSILPNHGRSILISYRDILEVSGEDYKIYLPLTSKEKLTLFDLGYHYEDFLRNLSKLRNELIINDMLMEEKVRKSGVEAEFVYLDGGGKELDKGRCEPRLYETAMVIIREKRDPIRIPYSDILKTVEEDYTLAVTRESGEKSLFSQMGKELDPFKKALSEAINEISLKAQSSLKELLPEVDPSIIKKASRFMKEGRAAWRSDIESVSKGLWEKLEKRLEVLGIKEEYDFLKAISQKEKICIGLKRGLLGDLTGEYIWFLVPIYGIKQGEPGNAIVMEAVNDEGGGRATYLFRVMSRKDYSDQKNLDDLHKEVDKFINTINRCMIDINFRREPIYLPDEKLDELEYQRYRFSIQKLPALQTLRQLFIGRVIHSSTEQWQKDVMDLLRFNVSAKDDNVRWDKEKET